MSWACTESGVLARNSAEYWPKPGIRGQAHDQPTRTPSLLIEKLPAAPSRASRRSELVALAVSAEIVVIAEDQHTGAAPDMRPKVVGGLESADVADDDYQILRFVPVRHRRQVHVALSRKDAPLRPILDVRPAFRCTPAGNSRATARGRTPTPWPTAIRAQAPSAAMLIPLTKFRADLRPIPSSRS
jgi:hypothetical protein